MEWSSNELILEFINLYKKHRVLWDPKHSNHKNRKRLNDAWLDIAREFSIDVTVEVLRRKKESLMATYRTLAKKVRDSETTETGAKDVYKPSWFAYDAIDRFIRPTRKKTSSLSSGVSDQADITQNDESEIESQVGNVFERAGSETAALEPPISTQAEKNVLEQPESRTGNILQQPPSQAGYTVQQQSRTMKRKRDDGKFSEKFVSSVLQRLDNILTNVTGTSKKSEFDIFGQNVAAQLNNMPLVDALQLQLEIQQLIMRKRLNNITHQSSRQSMQSNNSPQFEIENFSDVHSYPVSNTPELHSNISDFSEDSTDDDSIMSYVELI